MSIRRSIALLSSKVVGPITLAYKRRIISGNLRSDSAQILLSSKLDELYSSLISPSGFSGGISSRFSIPDEHVEFAARYYGGSSISRSSAMRRMIPTTLMSENFTGFAIAAAHSLINGYGIPKGIYVHGSVGVGKSMLMDLFYTVCKDGLSIPEENISYKPISRRRKRLHLKVCVCIVLSCEHMCHKFMLDVHQRIHNYKTSNPKADPIPPVAASIALEARLLCFDEMQITDIADAMIIKRLFTILLDLGVVIVTTSNRPPCGLYEGGINRSIFLPFIDTLNERMIVIEMDGHHDYRRDVTLLNDNDEDEATRLDSSLPTHVCTATNSPSVANDILQQWFNQGSKGQSKSETLPVAMGRSIHVNKSNNNCGWFTFNELCKQPLGAADYLAIANRYKIVIVENVPQLDGQVYNEARRFVTLIDALYEARTKLVISSNVVSIHELFIGFDATVETHDGDEEIAIDESNTINNKESSIIGEGGSSSSHSTTIIRTKDDGKVEWSGTGRIGVSLAQLSAVREVSFSFQRAGSRMAEMSSSKWGRV